jgi:hypothetical protein
MGIGRRRSNERGVDPFIAQVFDEVVAVPLLQRDGHQGIRFTKKSGGSKLSGGGPRQAVCVRY